MEAAIQSLSDLARGMRLTNTELLRAYEEEAAYCGRLDEPSDKLERYRREVKRRLNVGKIKIEHILRERARRCV